MEKIIKIGRRYINPQYIVEIHDYSDKDYDREDDDREDGDRVVVKTKDDSISLVGSYARAFLRYVDSIAVDVVNNG